MARSKYNVSSNKDKRTYSGIVFDSELEMKYYKEIVLPKFESGEIINYELQKEYILQEKFEHRGKKVQAIKYVADFYIVYKDGHEELIDTKGMPDAVATLKRKMMWYLYPTIEYHWYAYSKIDGGWIEYDELKKARALRKKTKGGNGNGRKKGN